MDSGIKRWLRHLGSFFRKISNQVEGQWCRKTPKAHHHNSKITNNIKGHHPAGTTAANQEWEVLRTKTNLGHRREWEEGAMMVPDKETVGLMSKEGLTTGALLEVKAEKISTIIDFENIQMLCQDLN